MDAKQETPKMTVKQQRFCDFYIISGNATDAAIQAGYSKKTANRIGSENLDKPAIKAYIDARMTELQSERVADQQEILEYLTAVMRRELKEYTPIATFTEKVTWKDGKKHVMKSEGVQLVEVPAPLAAANKAAELLGKRYGMFVDRKEINGTGGNLSFAVHIDYGEGEADNDGS